MPTISDYLHEKRAKLAHLLRECAILARTRCMDLERRQLGAFSVHNENVAYGNPKISISGRENLPMKYCGRSNSGEETSWLDSWRPIEYYFLCFLLVTVTNLVEVRFIRNMEYTQLGKCFVSGVSPITVGCSHPGRICKRKKIVIWIQ